MVMQKSEYDKNYFEADNTRDTHPVGYSEYKRTVIFDAITTRELWELAHFNFFDLHRSKLENAKVLELGCSKGLLVEDFLSFGVNIIGIDFSNYIISQVKKELKSLVKLGDALDLSSYKNNEFDVVIGLRFLPCIADADLPNLIREIKRISRFQIQVVDDLEFYLAHPKKFKIGIVNTHYNVKTLAEWRTIVGNQSITTSIGDEIWAEYR